MNFTSNEYFFPLEGQRFDSNDEVITQTNVFVEDPGKSYYSERIKKLKKRWTNYILARRKLILANKTFFCRKNCISFKKARTC